MYVSELNIRVKLYYYYYKFNFTYKIKCNCQNSFDNNIKIYYILYNQNGKSILTSFKSF